MSANAPMTLPPRPSPYTQRDQDTVAWIKKWLAEHDKSRSWLGKASSVPSGTLSQILAGKYISSPSKQLAAMASSIHVETQRLKDGASGYVKGSIHHLMHVVFERTRKHQNFGVITAYVGVGKTRTAKEYRASTPMTMFIESSPQMTAGVLLTEILTQLKLPHPHGLDRKFKEVVRALKGTNYLLIVDEAENCSAAALHYLRRIRDMALVGVVLQGTEKLSMLITPHHGQFDQIRSRVGMWPKTIERIDRDDADDMARAALADFGEVSDDVLDTLWAYCDGSARVLNENLVAAVKDYGVGKGALTAALVKQIAKTVLFMEAPKAQGGKA